MLMGKKKRFFDEYIIDRNGARAAVAAGYAPGSAKQRAYKLLHENDIAEAVKEWDEQQHREKTAERNEVIEFLTEVMRGEHEVENIPIFIGDGEQQFKKGLPSVKDRLKAAEMLGRHYAMFTDKTQIEGAVPIIISGGDEIED